MQLVIPDDAPRRILEDGIDVTYTPGFIDGATSSHLLAETLAEAAWDRPHVHVFGRWHRVPRWVAWHSDPGYGYRYSGHEHGSCPWTPALQAIRERVEAQVGHQNAVLANLYRDGTHRMGTHADDESDLQPGAPIVMVSLGATRRFVLNHRHTRTRYVIPVADGSLLIMAGSTNRVAMHGVPPTRRNVGLRISLTFRRMRPQHPKR